MHTHSKPPVSILQQGLYTGKNALKPLSKPTVRRELSSELSNDISEIPNIRKQKRKTKALIVKPPVPKPVIPEAIKRLTPHQKTMFSLKHRQTILDVADLFGVKFACEHFGIAWATYKRIKEHPETCSIKMTDQQKADLKADSILERIAGFEKRVEYYSYRYEEVIQLRHEVMVLKESFENFSKTTAMQISKTLFSALLNAFINQFKNSAPDDEDFTEILKNSADVDSVEKFNAFLASRSSGVLPPAIETE